MRVAIFLPSGKIGGAEQVLLQIAKRYAQKGANVDIYLISNLEAIKFKEKLDASINLIVFDVSRELKGVACLLKFFLLKSKRLVYDYSYTSHVHVNSFISILRKLSIFHSKFHIARESTSVFLRYKGNSLKYYKLLYFLGYKTIDLIVCQSEIMKAQLLENKPKLKKRKVVVINNPITLPDKDLASPNPLPNREYIVSAGRLIPEKGFDILIEAFKVLSRQHPALELVILGEGGSRNNLEKQIDAAVLNGKVHLVGFVENVYSYFTYAKMCVVSSRIEGFPNVLLQMMSCNNRVVSTLCAGGIENIKGVTTCKTGDTSDLIEAISQSMRMEETYTRKVFDEFLSKNDITKYIETVEDYLN